MALNSLICADVSLRNCSLTHLLTAELLAAMWTAWLANVRQHSSSMFSGQSDVWWSAWVSACVQTEPCGQQMFQSRRVGRRRGA